ncbi:hypothetical protein Mapa_007836 [Marchantia paleacea]|nr:hypothetical protein Mapa_007836 [Marchantia paleacea]
MQNLAKYRFEAGKPKLENLRSLVIPGSVVSNRCHVEDTYSSNPENPHLFSYSIKLIR